MNRAMKSDFCHSQDPLKKFAATAHQNAGLQQDIKNLSLIIAETADYMRQADHTRS